MLLSCCKLLPVDMVNKVRHVAFHCIQTDFFRKKYEKEKKYYAFVTTMLVNT